MIDSLGHGSVDCGKSEPGARMSETHWHTKLRVALRTTLLSLASIAVSIVMSSFSRPAAFAVLAGCLIAVGTIETVAWRRRVSSHRGDTSTANTLAPSQPVARRKILGRGMSQVHISGLPLLTVDVVDLLKRVDDMSERFGRYYTLAEANELPLIGPFAEARDVVQVALNNGFLQLVWVEMAGNSYLKLTERGKSILDAEPRGDDQPATTLKLPITATAGNIIVVSPGKGEHVAKTFKLVGYANTFEGSVVVEAVDESGGFRPLAVARGAMSEDITDINRFEVEITLPKPGRQSIRIGAYSPSDGTDWDGVYLEVDALPDAEIIGTTSQRETARSVTIFGVPARAGAETPEPEMAPMERFRQEWASKDKREVAKATARAYIASHPDMVIEFGGKTYKELVDLVDQHRAAGRHDEVTRVDMWITGSLPPPVITGTAEVSLQRPTGDGQASQT